MAQDHTAGFFLTIFRSWEFGAGGLILWLDRYGPKSELLADVIYGLGLSALVWCCVAYDRAMVFPGLSAIIPVLGTAAMIFAGNRSRLASALTVRPAVFLGEISYSLYLVHWPVVVFAALSLQRPFETGTAFMLMLLCLALAVLLFYGIERRYRSGSRTNPKKILVALGVGTAVTASASLHAWSTDGKFALRVSSSEIIQKVNAFDIEAAKIYLWKNVGEFERAASFSTSGTKVLLLGDSQAGDLLNMLREGGVDDKVEIIARKVYYECGLPYLPTDEREPFWSTVNPDTQASPKMVEMCTNQMNHLSDGGLLAEADIVVIGYLWRDFAIPYIENSIAAIDSQMTGKRFVLGPKTMLASSIDIVNSKPDLIDIESYAWSFKSEDAGVLSKEMSDKYGDGFIDAFKVVCPTEGKCHVLTPKLIPVLWDTNHLTQAGARYVWENGGREMFGFLTD